MKTYINMACGLANRMFQYCYYKYLEKKGYDVGIDFYKTAALAHEEVSWSAIFPNAKFKKASKVNVALLGGGASIVNRVRRKIPFMHWTIEANNAYDVPIPPKDKKRYILGVFQNAEMVETVKEEILEAFTFQPLEGKGNLKLAEELRQVESVAIHVRKGKDYQQRIWYQNTCPVDYYEKAVKYIKSVTKNPKFYVFTDNPDWVRKNFKGFDYTLVEGNPGAGWGSHFDMQLMSMCKHNIISNSTYAWWGAYLNRNLEKKVIIPKIWFNPDSCLDYTSDKISIKSWISI